MKAVAYMYSPQGRRLVSKEFRQRLVYHEAGHLLVGYCMGIPVAEYQANDAILNAVQVMARRAGRGLGVMIGLQDVGVAVKGFAGREQSGGV